MRDFPPQKNKSTILLIVTIASILIAGCSSIKSKIPVGKEKEYFIKAFNKICFNGQGKGRINLNDQVIPFKFESLKKLNRMSYAFKVPTMGEEILHIDYSNALKGRTRLSGGFIRKLGNILKKEGRYSDLKKINFFLSQWAKLLATKENGGKQINCQKSDYFPIMCANNSSNRKKYKRLWFIEPVEDRLTFKTRYKKSDELSLWIFADDRDKAVISSKFKTLTFKVENDVESRVDFSMDLIYAECN